MREYQAKTLENGPKQQTISDLFVLQLITKMQATSRDVKLWIGSFFLFSSCVFIVMMARHAIYNRDYRRFQRGSDDILALT